ncbi:unnamed protein product [marine sediment metagenome]|uniref:Hydrogenase maturation factor HypA n=1 Tax=marine sediment metagenome TaxID=412755 RepID=X1SXJ5_9ZZZZ
MHEISYIKQIIENAKKEKGNIKSILVEVGELAPVQAEDIEKTLKEMVDWEIVVAQKRAVVKCSCGYKGHPKIIEKRHHLTLFVCPKCSSLPKVYEGKDIILKEVTVDDKKCA